MLKKIDRKNRFVSMFDPKTGFYARSGVIDENGKDTGVDPFMTSYPELIDVGVMGHCVHGASGLCLKSGVQCYQNGLKTHHPNMTIENFKRIVDECKGKTFQLALGGRGDVDQHENFAEILQYCRESNIVPNFTSSGLGFTDEIVSLCKEYCGAVAISWYRQPHTLRAIQMLLDAGIKTNIHYVLGQNSIDEAIERLSKVPCEKVCEFMATPFADCVERSKHRDRVVPYEVLERMYKSIWIPQYYEGWDMIHVIYPDGFKTLDTKELFWGENGLAWLDQDNPHHDLTVGAHCIATYANIHNGSPELYEAAMLHDIGKAFTKAFKNSNGEDTDIAHYYEHHHVSAYDSLFYTQPALDVLYVAGVIQWHMRPFELERVPHAEKAVAKFKRLIGDKMYADVMALHEADIKAKMAPAEETK